MDKQTPQAIEVEQAILGTCMTDNHAFLEIQDIITPECFYIENHRLIYSLCLRIVKPDLILIETALKEGGKLEAIGGIDYLADLMSAGTPQHEKYCQILIEYKIRRDVIQASQNLLKSAHNGVDAFELVDDFARIGSEIGLNSGINHSLTPAQIRERDKSKPKAEKLYLGHHQIDDGIYSDGMRRGQVELTIADSGHGKTHYALFKAASFLRKGYKVAWFQLEGYDSETSDHIFENKITQHNNIHICDSLYDIEDIKREARRLNREHNLDFIVFDYVQNIECKQSVSKTEKVEYISRQITRMAKELNVVCNPLSQVTINYSTRGGWSQEPGYGDVRWSQQLKQDASIITSVFRPSRIESLVIDQDRVRDWRENPQPFNSVFIKQAKVRHGKQEWKRLHLIHTEKGLKPYESQHPEPVKPYHIPESDFDESPF